MTGVFWNAKRVEAPRSTVLSEATAKHLLAELKDASFAFYVVRDGAAIRESPSTSARILKKEIKGAEVYTAPRPGPWKKVRDGDIEGWMRSDEISLDPP